jgi:hypothetical protein
MGVTMWAERFIGQARRWRLDFGLRLRINRTFKRFRYKMLSEFPPVLEFPMPIVDLPAARRAMVTLGRHQFFRIVLFSITIIFAILALRPPAGADEGRTLIIPPNDGYGFEECLTPGSQCGLVVADAWCKAHGFASSQGFRPETSGTAGVPAGSIRVTCGGEID